MLILFRDRTKEKGLYDIGSEQFEVTELISKITRALDINYVALIIFTGDIIDANKKWIDVNILDTKS